MTVAEVAEVTRAANRPNQLVNAFENYQRIKQMFREGVPCLSMIHLPQGMPMMIVGGGPSLDDLLPKLKGWTGGMICTPQTWPSLKAHGIIPNFVFAMDPSIEDVYPLDGEGDQWTTLVTHPSIHPKMFDAWKGTIALMRVNFEDPEEDTAFDMAYQTMIRAKVGAQGNVANMAFQCTRQWGCNPVVFAGVDLACIEGKDHADYYENLGAYKYKPRPFLMASSNKSVMVPLPNPDERGLKVDDVNQFYSVLMLAMWKQVPEQRVYSISEGINPFPKISIEDCMAGKWPPPMARDEIFKFVDERTIPHGVYGRFRDGKPERMEFANEVLKDAAIGKARIEAGMQPTAQQQESIEIAKLWHKVGDDWHRSVA